MKSILLFFLIFLTACSNQLDLGENPSSQESLLNQNDSKLIILGLDFLNITVSRLLPDIELYDESQDMSDFDELIYIGNSKFLEENLTLQLNSFEVKTFRNESNQLVRAIRFDNSSDANTVLSEFEERLFLLNDGENILDHVTKNGILLISNGLTFEERATITSQLNQTYTIRVTDTINPLLIAKSEQTIVLNYLDKPSLLNLSLIIQNIDEAEPYQIYHSTIYASPLRYIEILQSQLSSYVINNLKIIIEDTNSELLYAAPELISQTVPGQQISGLPGVCRVPHDLRIRNPYVEEILGFPRPSNRLPNDRNSKAIVLYATFPDYPASKPIDRLNDDFQSNFVGFVNDYIRTMSYGRVEHEFYFHTSTITMPKPVEEYYLNFDLVKTAPRLPVGVDYVSIFARELLEIADPEVDFSDYDYVLIITDPSIPLSKANFDWLSIPREEDAYVTEEKRFYNINFWTNTVYRPDHQWVGLHELMHLYGLVDYYALGGDGTFESSIKHVGNFDLMGYAMGANNELLLWSRWFIGWVSDDNIHCIDGRNPIPETIVNVNPTMSIDAKNGVIIRISQFELLLIERKDNNQYCQACNGGILVTKYDASISSSYGLLKIMRPEYSVDEFYEDAFLYIGNQITIDNVTIEVISHNKEQTGLLIKTT